MTFHPLYLEWEDLSAGPTLICVVVIIMLLSLLLLLCVCWLYIWVGAEVVSFVYPISWVVLDLWLLLLVGKGYQCSWLTEALQLAPWFSLFVGWF